ncbi:hypothetical protein BH10ACI1_BH10ACI1_20560 [soil metagenome]
MAFRRWFPLSLVEQSAFFANFTAVFVENALAWGFTAEDIAKLEADNAVMQYLVQTEVFLKAFRSSFSQLRNNLIKGKGNKMSAYTQFVPITEPPIVPYGIFDRLFRLADRITVAENYTAVIGAQLGILPKSSEGKQIEEMSLKLKASPMPKAQLEVRFVRGRSSGVNLYFRRVGNEELIDLGRYIQSPAIVKIPLTDGKPEQIYLCGRYLDGNDAVGSYSAFIELLIAP